MTLSAADEARVVRAVANAERGNRGEVRVHLEGWCPTEPVSRAREVYRALQMDRTRDDTAVLLYVAEKSRVCAAWAGQGVHARADAAFWKAATDAVAEGFRQDRPADGLCEALGRIGELLRLHVPGEDHAGNELPDTLSRGAFR